MLRPKLSSDSLIKQVVVLQGNMIKRKGDKKSDSYLAEKVRVQDDIVEQMCKIQQLLTRYPQEQKISLNDSEMGEDPLDQLLGPYEDQEIPEIDFSVGSEPIFKVEKVCRNPFSNLLSFTDLDSASDRASVSANFDGIQSEFDADSEMELEQSSFTFNEEYTEPCNQEVNMSQWTGSFPTNSCTHSYTG